MKILDTSEVPTNARCAHHGCHCIIAIAKAVIRAQEYYCSVSCADGTGCAHPACGCVAGAPANKVPS